MPSDVRRNSTSSLRFTYNSCALRRNLGVHRGFRDTQIRIAVLYRRFTLDLGVILSLPLMVAGSSLRAISKEKVPGDRGSCRPSDFRGDLVHHHLARPIT